MFSIMLFNPGKWTEKELNEIIRQASVLREPGERITFISGRFLGINYLSGTLIGSKHQQEELVINLEGLDCFTLLDYIEAMRISCSYDEFMDNLIKVRYRNGVVSFVRRNHFFTDWAAYRPSQIKDMTNEIGKDSVIKAKKILNLKNDNSLYIDGLRPVKRIISHIPSLLVNEEVLGLLKNGDYAGIYSDRAGLDVSHVGIVIRKKEGLYLRHASSQKESGSVIDQDLIRYIQGKPGIVILRPLN